MVNGTRTRSDVKREAIIQAAKRAFKTFGVNGTSMDKLAEMAQVSKRTVYNHFRAKEDLVMHLIKEQYQNALVDADAAYCSEVSLEKQLVELLMAQIIFTTSEEHMDLARVIIGHFFYEPDKLKDEITQLKDQETFFHRWLRAAQQDGKLSFDDVETVCIELDALIKGQCFWPQLFKLEDPLTDAQKHHIASNTARLILSRYQI